MATIKAEWLQTNKAILKELYQNYLNTADMDDPDFMDYKQFSEDYKNQIGE